MARRKHHRPTPAELAILTVLWEQGPATVRQVHEALGGDGRTGYTTTLKLMQIMTEKGLLARDESRRSHVYRPTVGREKTQRRLLGEMVDRVFGGSTRKLILHALSTGDIPPDEVEQIRRLLRQQEDGGNDNA